MTTTPVNLLKPGMVLSKDARAPNGIVLLGKGASLNERSIAILNSWGVNEVDVEATETGSSKTPGAELSETEQLLIRKQVERRFRHNDLDDPVVNELLKVSLHQEMLRALRTK